MTSSRRTNIEIAIAAVAMFCVPIALHAHAKVNEHRQLIDATGAFHTANIDGGVISTSRRSSSTKLHLSWIDAQGRAKSARNIEITSDLAGKIVKDKTLTADTIAIKVVAGREQPLIVSELSLRLQNYEDQRVYLGVAGALAAFAYLGLLLQGRRRRAASVGAAVNA